MVSLMNSARGIARGSLLLPIKSVWTQGGTISSTLMMATLPCKGILRRILAEFVSNGGKQTVLGVSPNYRRKCKPSDEWRIRFMAPAWYKVSNDA